MPACPTCAAELAPDALVCPRCWSTLDTSRWFFGEVLRPVLVIAALAVWSFYASRGGEPLFGRRLLD